MSDKIVWATKVVKISEIKPLERNPRTITSKDYAKLKKDMSSVGNFKPLICDKDLTVLGGNQRLRVLMENIKDAKEVEVSIPDRLLTEAERKKVIVLDNMHRGDFDMDMLANEFEDALNELGFDELLPEDVAEVEEDDYTEPDDLKTDIQLGDVYQLGNHRLMCGDSTKIENVEKLMNGEKAKCIFTSPPYNMGSNMYKYYSDNKKSSEYIQFNLDVVSAWSSILDCYMFWNISYNKKSLWGFLEIMYEIIKETG